MHWVTRINFSSASLLVLSIASSLASLNGAISMPDVSIPSFAKALHGKTSLCENQAHHHIMADPENCYKFFICNNGQAVKFTCKNGFHFDKDAGICMPGTCDDAAHECVDGHIEPVPDDCRKFSTCSEGKLQVNECGNGYYFVALYGICASLQNDVATKCACIMPEGTVLPNADDCTTFYRCTNRTAQLEQCRSGQYFNDKINSCVHDVKAECVKASVTTPASEPESICHRAEDNTETIFFRAHPTDNDKYYMCLHGRAFVLHCPRGFNYSSHLQICNKHTNAPSTAGDDQLQNTTQVETLGVGNVAPGFDLPTVAVEPPMATSAKPLEANAAGNSAEIAVEEPLCLESRPSEMSPVAASEDAAKEELQLQIAEHKAEQEPQQVVEQEAEHKAEQEAEQKATHIETEPDIAKGKVVTLPPKILQHKPVAETLYDKLSSKFMIF